MRRYWITPENLKSDKVIIKGELFHHICDVCRTTEGDRFELLCGDGWAYLAELTKVSRKDADAVVIEKRQIEPLPKPHLHLCISVPRFQKMDLILEKAVELGVFEVIPFVS